MFYGLTYNQVVSLILGGLVCGMLLELIGVYPKVLEWLTKK